MTNAAVGFHNVEVDLTSKIVSTKEETLHRCVLLSIILQMIYLKR
jgi:hypothetical protein